LYLKFIEKVDCSLFYSDKILLYLKQYAYKVYYCFIAYCIICANHGPQLQENAGCFSPLLIHPQRLSVQLFIMSNRCIEEPITEVAYILS